MQRQEKVDGSLKKFPFITTNNLIITQKWQEKKKILLAQENKQNLIFKWDIIEFLAMRQSHG